jgi:mycothiol synthase
MVTNQPVEMLWPARRLYPFPTSQVPPGYLLRTSQRGDETGFYRLMSHVGWHDWSEEKLRLRSASIPFRCWWVGVHKSTGVVVASAMGFREYAADSPFDAILGWIAADPAHTGHGLGQAVTASATAGLIAAGYPEIHLYTSAQRLPALKTYLRVGYVPSLRLPEMAERWQVICKQLSWPYTPELWSSSGIQ